MISQNGKADFRNGFCNSCNITITKCFGKAHAMNTAMDKDDKSGEVTHKAITAAKIKTN